MSSEIKVDDIKIIKEWMAKNGEYHVIVNYCPIPEKVEISGWILPVPYAMTNFVSGQKTCYAVGVEIPPDKLLEYINNGQGRLDLDYIQAIYPYGDNCPIDEALLKNPKFINKPVHYNYNEDKE